jgi:hypothetical protein
MTADPLVPGPVYGLRTWTVTGEAGSERLAGPQRGAVWPIDGEWFAAACSSGHPAPAPDCGCGAHAWHPRPRWARRTVASRREVPGVVEGRGAIEVHADGFRAERARPYALFAIPGVNRARLDRLAAAYRVPVVEVRGPRDVLAWCRERDLGMDEAVVDALLAPTAEARRRARRHRARVAGLRIAALAAVVGVLLAFGLQPEPKGDRTLGGRTGVIHVHH